LLETGFPVLSLPLQSEDGDEKRTGSFWIKPTAFPLDGEHGPPGATFTVRRVSFGVGIERIFPLHSPTISSIQVVGKGKVRRARLYYLRDLKGKAARIKRAAREEAEPVAAAVAAGSEGQA